MPPPFFDFPDYIQIVTPNITDSTIIDLVFTDFIEDEVLDVLNEVQEDVEYTKADIRSYSPLMANEVLGVFAQLEWN